MILSMIAFPPGKATMSLTGESIVSSCAPGESCRISRAGAGVVGVCAAAFGMTASMAANPPAIDRQPYAVMRSEEHTSELQSLMRSSYAVFCLKKKKKTKNMSLQHNVHSILEQRAKKRET